MKSDGIRAFFYGVLALTFPYAVAAASDRVAVTPSVGKAGLSCNAEDCSNSELEDTALLQFKGRGSSQLSQGRGKDVLAWCTSGGGFRAFASSAGFAHAFAVAELFNKPEFAAIGSSSGSSWFLAKYAYDPAFYNNVSFTDADTFHKYMLELLTKYEAYLNVPPSEASWKGAVTVLEDVLGEVLSAYVDTTIKEVNTLASFDWSWLSLTQGLIDIPSPGVASLSANSASRAGLKGPELHFQTASLPMAYVKSQNSDVNIVEMTLQTPTKPVAMNRALATPLQWIVPGAGAGVSSGRFLQPSRDVAEYVGEPNFTGGFSRNVHATSLPTELTVGQVAAMSSASRGSIANPLGTASIIAEFGIPGLDAASCDILLQLLPNLPALAVCSNGIGPKDICEYPKTKFTDGGFVDDFGVAQTVGSLQKTHGRDARLRLLLTDNNGFDNGAPWTYDLAALFSDPAVDTQPGKLVTLYTKTDSGELLVAYKQVFAVPYSEISWHNLASGPEKAGTPTYAIQWAQIKTHTVDNPGFDVLGGTEVDALFFRTNSQAGTWLDAPPEMFADLAAATGDLSITKILTKWMAEEEI